MSHTPSSDSHANDHHGDHGSPHYYVPGNSSWPIFMSLSLLALVTGFTMLFNQISGAFIMFLIGFILTLSVMYGWWKTVAQESETGCYKSWEDKSFRWGMGWFIFSEVMFFGAFFGALFYARILSVPDLGDTHSKIIWPDYHAVWPTAGPYFTQNAVHDFQTIPWSGVPLINTAVLLLSGVTITWAHWALKLRNRAQLNIGMALTILLGIIFLILQAAEYIHAYQDLNLRLDSGIYGSTFFMLTGFHGFHVTVGTLALIVIFIRCLIGHFKPEHHFGFEAVAWYWHFVDVVWLLLFVLVYFLA